MRPSRTARARVLVRVKPLGSCSDDGIAGCADVAA